MKSRRAIALLLIALMALLVWRSQLFTVSRPGDRPRPLALIDPRDRSSVSLDVVLPAVPIGMERLRPGDAPLLVHYWAPWERHGVLQAQLLDSLRRDVRLEGLRVVVVCFDPFPSVARFVARNRLRLNVLLDGRRELRQALPCPSIPFTYVIDRSGRLMVAQPGEIEWLAPATLATLRQVLTEPDSAMVTS